MTTFRILLALMCITITAYTVAVGTHHGWNFASIFFNDIAAVNWAGQFNLDFSCLLLLTGLWIAWRSRFSFIGIAAGAFTLIGGVPFVCVYVLALSFRKNASIQQLLTGEHGISS